jgi:hypothetical protein
VRLVAVLADDSVRSSAAGPATQPGPFGLPAPQQPYADLDHILSTMRRATGRDEILQALILGMSTVAHKVGVFALRKTGFRGVACNAALADADVFRELNLPAAAPTVFAEAVRRGSYFGPLPRTAPHDVLWNLLLQQPSGGAPDKDGDVLVFVVPVSGRPAAIVFADNLGDSISAARRAELLAAETGRALLRVVTNAKSGKRGSG